MTGTNDGNLTASPGSFAQVQSSINPMKIIPDRATSTIHGAEAGVTDPMANVSSPSGSQIPGAGRIMQLPFRPFHPTPQQNNTLLRVQRDLRNSLTTPLNRTPLPNRRYSIPVHVSESDANDDKTNGFSHISFGVENHTRPALGVSHSTAHNNTLVLSTSRATNRNSDDWFSNSHHPVEALRGANIARDVLSDPNDPSPMSMLSAACQARGFNPEWQSMSSTLGRFRLALVVDGTYIEQRSEYSTASEAKAALAKYALETICKDWNIPKFGHSGRTPRSSSAWIADRAPVIQVPMYGPSDYSLHQAFLDGVAAAARLAEASRRPRDSPSRSHRVRRERSRSPVRRCDRGEYSGGARRHRSPIRNRSRFLAAPDFYPRSGRTDHYSPSSPRVKREKSEDSLRHIRQLPTRGDAANPPSSSSHGGRGSQWRQSAALIEGRWDHDGFHARYPGAYPEEMEM